MEQWSGQDESAGTGGSGSNHQQSNADFTWSTGAMTAHQDVDSAKTLEMAPRSVMDVNYHGGGEILKDASFANRGGNLYSASLMKSTTSNSSWGLDSGQNESIKLPALPIPSARSSVDSHFEAFGNNVVTTMSLSTSSELERSTLPFEGSIQNSTASATFEFYNKQASSPSLHSASLNSYSNVTPSTHSSLPHPFATTTGPRIQHPNPISTSSIHHHPSPPTNTLNTSLLARLHPSTRLQFHLFDPAPVSPSPSPSRSCMTQGPSLPPIHHPTPTTPSFSSHIQLPQPPPDMSTSPPPPPLPPPSLSEPSEPAPPPTPPPPRKPKSSKSKRSAQVAVSTSSLKFTPTASDLPARSKYEPWIRLPDSSVAQPLHTAMKNFQRSTVGSVSQEMEAGSLTLTTLPAATAS
ncbi:hypothetical protein BC829DRAFT_388311, partial [Chytridium lagenaria]